MRLLCYTVHIVFILFEISIPCGTMSPKVTTDQGVVVGKYTETHGKRAIASFQGIPYAKPPTGDLRFEAPVPADTWTGTYKAKKPPPECVQYQIGNLSGGVIGQEDCLYLNVYSPQLPLNNKTKLLDVIAFIHGGSFTVGSGLTQGPSILLDRNVVLVTFNYRLGPMGFLCTEDNVVPGNNGLKDQVLALKWIQKNIAVFGGNPNSVTLGGISAGGASCSLHLLSPLSKGAICMSGVATNPWALAENSKKKTKLIAANLDCPTDNSITMTKCLKEKPADKIVKNVKKFMHKKLFPFTPFGPVIEPNTSYAFISDSPINIISQKKGSDVPVIFSHVLKEGASFAANPEILKEIKNNLDDMLPHLLDYNFTVHADRRAEVIKQIKKFYKIDDDQDKILHFVKLVGDRLFVAGISQIAKTTAAHSMSPVYVYRFSYVGKFGIIKQILSVICPGCPIDNELEKYPTHGEDALYTLGLGQINNLEDEAGIRLTKEMQDIWVSFAADGKLGKNWQSVKNQLPKIIFTDIKGPGDFRLIMDNELGEESFWRSLGLNENIEASKRPHEEL